MNLTFRGWHLHSLRTPDAAHLFLSQSSLRHFEQTGRSGMGNTLPRLAGVDHHFCETLRIPASFFLMKQEIMGCAKKIRRRDFCLVLCSAPSDTQTAPFFLQAKKSGQGGQCARWHLNVNPKISGYRDCGIVASCWISTGSSLSDILSPSIRFFKVA